METAKALVTAHNTKVRKNNNKARKNAPALVHLLDLGKRVTVGDVSTPSAAREELCLHGTAVVALLEHTVLEGVEVWVVDVLGNA